MTTTDVHKKKNLILMVNLTMVVVGMCLLAYASVPLYNMFCRVTGYGGTTQRAQSAPLTAGSRMMTVRFNTDISKKLGWEFKPMQLSVDVLNGREKLVFFKAKNNTDKTLTGVAIYNVTPDKVGQYFNKVQCFCFDNIQLGPHEERIMPVSFYIDPEMEKDRNLDDVRTVTLSYTFFPAADAPQAPPVSKE